MILTMISTRTIRGTKMIRDTKIRTKGSNSFLKK
jgi:hypothetical protein